MWPVSKVDLLTWTRADAVCGVLHAAVRCGDAGDHGDVHSSEKTAWTVDGVSLALVSWWRRSSSLSSGDET